MKRTLILLLFALACQAAALRPGLNSIPVRGHAQDVYFYPAAGAARGVVLFLPGDGGWRGFAVDMARRLSSAGFDVCGWDIRKYLEGFTTGSSTLREEDIQRDAALLTASVAAGRRVTLVGWSQGAAMAVLAASVPERENRYAGVVALGLPDKAVLGWRWTDNLTYITGREPDEPVFFTGHRLAALAPLRLAMLQSASDEYISPDTTRRLFSLAKEPKRLEIVAARNHRYEGNQEEFFHKLEEYTRWASAAD